MLAHKFGDEDDGFVFHLIGIGPRRPNLQTGNVPFFMGDIFLVQECRLLQNLYTHTEREREISGCVLSWERGNVGVDQIIFFSK